VLDRRVLWHSLHLEGDPRVVARLAALLPDAQHPVPARRTTHYVAAPVGGGIAVTEEGDALAIVADPDEAADLVHVRVHRRAFELASLAGWVRVHAATVDLGGIRVLIVGPSGAGKSTLAARLLLDGADVQGDESVLVRRGESLPVPRALHLKPGSAELLPELADVLPAVPAVGDVTVVDPARVGRPLVLRVAPVDHVVLLTATSSDPVTCTPADGGAVLSALLADAFPLTETKASMVSAVAGAISSARGHRLTSGPPAAMVDVLRAAIS
jgi:hypothetical protein